MLQRHHEHRVRHVADARRHARGEALVVAAVGHGDRLAASSIAGAGQPLSRRQADAHRLLGEHAPGGPVDQLAGGLLDQRDRRRGGVEHAGRGAHHRLEQARRGRCPGGWRPATRRARPRPASPAPWPGRRPRRSGGPAWGPARAAAPAPARATPRAPTPPAARGPRRRAACPPAAPTRSRPARTRPLRGDTPSPTSTSGAMYFGVPIPRVPSPSSACSRATPKSTSTTPSSPAMRLCGFTSRCTTCCSCTYSSASAAWREMSSTSSSGRPGRARAPPARRARSVPATSSITSQLRPSSSRWSITFTTRGWRQAREQPRLDVEAGGLPGVGQQLERHLAALARRARGRRRPSPRRRCGRRSRSGRPTAIPGGGCGQAASSGCCRQRLAGGLASRGDQRVELVERGQRRCGSPRGGSSHRRRPRSPRRCRCCRA